MTLVLKQMTNRCDRRMDGWKDAWTDGDKENTNWLSRELSIRQQTKLLLGWEGRQRHRLLKVKRTR